MWELLLQLCRWAPEAQRGGEACLDSHSHEVGSTPYAHSSPDAMASLWATHSKSAPESCPLHPCPSQLPLEPSTLSSLFSSLGAPSHHPYRLAASLAAASPGAPAKPSAPFITPRQPEGAPAASLAHTCLRPLAVCAQAQTSGRQGGHPAPGPWLQEEESVSAGGSSPPRYKSGN